MNNELVLKESQDIQAMKNVEQQISDFRQEIMNGHAQKIPLNNLVALGTAFQPLTGMIQAAVSGGGGSGIYYVNTMGKTMHHFQGSSEFLGSLQTAAGTVGGGQARLTQLPCDPTMLFMAATLMNIEKKLDNIQETQEEILDFLKSKEKAVQKGNLNTLIDKMKDQNDLEHFLKEYHEPTLLRKMEELVEKYNVKLSKMEIILYQ